MNSDLDSYWKTVIAEVAAPAERTGEVIASAAATLGFLTRKLPDSGQSLVRREILLLVPTRYEWRVAVEGRTNGSAFSVRFGLLPGPGYYAAVLGLPALAAVVIITATSHPATTPAAVTIAAILFALPVVHGFAARWRAGRLEKALWRHMSALGPWLSSKIVVRSLNQAYGADHVIEGVDLAHPVKGDGHG